MELCKPVRSKMPQVYAVHTHTAVGGVTGKEGTFSQRTVSTRSGA